MMVVNGESTDPHPAELIPHFKIQGDCLHCLEKDGRLRKSKTRFLCPHLIRERLWLTHAIPFAEHLGKEKTLA